MVVIYALIYPFHMYLHMRIYIYIYIYIYIFIAVPSWCARLAPSVRNSVSCAPRNWRACRVGAHPPRWAHQCRFGPLVVHSAFYSSPLGWYFCAASFPGRAYFRLPSAAPLAFGSNAYVVLPGLDLCSKSPAVTGCAAILLAVSCP